MATCLSATWTRPCARTLRRARAHHRSIEEEARETLRLAIAHDACAPSPENIVDLFTRHFGREHGVDLDLPPPGAEPDRPAPDFSGPDDDV